MSPTAPRRAVSSPSSPPYLYSVHRLPQVVPASRPSPEVMSRKPLGILLTLLKSTLVGVLASVHSKRLSRFLTRLESTLTKNRGEGGSIAPAYLLPAIWVALLISPSATAQHKSPPPLRPARIQVSESSAPLHKTLPTNPPSP